MYDTIDSVKRLFVRNMFDCIRYLHFYEADRPLILSLMNFSRQVSGVAECRIIRMMQHATVARKNDVKIFRDFHFQVSNVFYFEIFYPTLERLWPTFPRYESFALCPRSARPNDFIYLESPCIVEGT